MKTPARITTAHRTNTWRVFFIGGWISYKALFTWFHPAVYFPSMFGQPLFQILFFAYLGRYSGLQSDAFFVVGNALHTCGQAGIYGVIMTVAYERYFQTLSPLLATPANRIALFLGRALPLIANGILVATFGLVVGLLFLDFRLRLSQLPDLFLVMIVTVSSCTALGLVLGTLGLRLREIAFAANVTYFVMLLLCGVNIPVQSLPRWMQVLSQGLPLTHGIQAARDIAAGLPLSSVTGLLWLEAAKAVFYAGFASTVFLYFEMEARRHGVLDQF